MGFTEAIRHGLRKYSDFSGRASRSEYWWFYLFVVLATYAGSVLDLAVFGTDATYPSRDTFTILASLALLIPTLAVGWRRMHDTGHTGLLYVLPLIVVYVGIVAFMMAGLATTFLERSGVEEDAIRGFSDIALPASIIVLILLWLGAGIWKIWMLLLPSAHGTNEYGPEETE